MTITESHIDLSAIKERQLWTWASGDYSAIAARIVPMAELLVESAGLRAGDAVLDVATGTGNAAIAAARRGCEVTGVDYVEALLERGRERAAAEGLNVTFTEGDASKGQALFAPCVACHSADGTGNEKLNAPPLNHTNDWYLFRSLQKFKAGIRGANPLDIAGAGMRPMAQTLTDEQAMKDVVAYISTL